MKVAVLGGGNIGSGLAYDCALRRHQVVVVEKDDTSCAQSRERVERTAGHGRMFSALAHEQTPQEVMARIEWTSDLARIGDCDFIVENIPEDIDLKAALYERLGQVARADVVVAANTSCIPITRLGSFFRHPDRVIGVHFMNPVFMKDTVEVILGMCTSDATREQCISALEQLGKHAIVVKDGPGFVSNRISHLFMNEAAFTIQDGLAQPADVDAIFRRCFGHSMGPLETADLIGIDTVVASLDVLYRMFQDSKYRVCPLMRRMVEAGRLGRKSGQGFYAYP